jgi:hypothetical protein
MLGDFVAARGHIRGARSFARETGIVQWDAQVDLKDALLTAREQGDPSRVRALVERALDLETQRGNHVLAVRIVQEAWSLLPEAEAIAILGRTLDAIGPIARPPASCGHEPGSIANSPRGSTTSRSRA